jgi:hypothetical protein
MSIICVQFPKSFSNTTALVGMVPMPRAFSGIHDASREVAQEGDTDSGTTALFSSHPPSSNSKFDFP